MKILKLYPHGFFYKIKKLKYLHQKLEKKENFYEGKIIILESINILDISKKILEDNKAEEIKCINTKNKTSHFDYLIIASGRSSRHVSAVTDDLRKKLKDLGVFCPQPEGKPLCDWTIIDANQVIIHLFRPEVRMRYNIEKLWDINFDSMKVNLIS